jgi:uncharacterized protein YeeX (DUF496 family)
MNKLANEIPNKIKQPAVCCVNCGKSYKKKTNLEKHSVICDLLQRSKRQNTNPVLDELLVEDNEPMPSQKRMFQMLIELGQRYNKLEDKVDELNKWVVRKKKKINVLEWLNVNINPTMSFENIIEKIIVTEEDIKNLLEKSFYDVMNDIFSRTIYNFEESASPIFAFVQKQHVFYIYDNTTTNSNNNSNDNHNNIKCWTELSKERLTKFLIKVHMKIVKAFYDWKNLKKNDIKNNETFSSLCDKTILKLLSVEFKEENIYSKVRNMMYSRMKKDMKSLVEYEFHL